MTSFSGFVFPLPDLSVIEARGADAVAFLQGQLTNDVSALDGGRACLAGYCTAKGRLLASMVVWRAESPDDTALRMLVKTDLAEALLKRLSMFVLRAKVKLGLVPLKIHGAIPASPLSSGHAAQQASGSGVQIGFPPPAAPWTVVHDTHGSWICAPAAEGGARWWLISGSQVLPESSAGHGSPWHVADISAGLPWVQAATQDVFIPQTLNLDLIDGVSFSKGCYPGQEVVARSHYRGTVKRRMVHAVAEAASGIDAAALAGVDTFDGNRPDAPCGRIVNAATDPDGALHVLMEVQLADLDTADFRLESAAGPALQVQKGQTPFGD